MRAVDTNVLVRLITRDDTRQAAAAEEFIAGGAWVSHLALAEASWVLASVYEFPPRDIATAVSMLLNHRDLSLQEPETVAAAVETFRHGPSLGFSDCLVVEVAKKAGHVPLGTFDRDLGRLNSVVKL